MTLNEKKYETLLLNTQRALLREVVPSLRGVAVDWKENTILIYFYNDGEISDKLEDDYLCVGTEVVADYYDAHISDGAIRLDFPYPLPDHQYWAYKRKEPPINKDELPGNSKRSLQTRKLGNFFGQFLRKKLTKIEPAEKNYGTLLLNTQKALLGKVVPSLRGVAVEWEGSTILMDFYNDGEISKELEKDYRTVGEEVIANYENVYIRHKIMRLDLPTPLPQRECWAYKRKEIHFLRNLEETF